VALPGAVFSSSVVNPLNGEPVADASVTLSVNGQQSGSAITDANGHFHLSCATCIVTIRISKVGFTDVTQEVRMLPRQVFNQLIFMAPTMQPGETAFVLTWDGNAMPDMDFTLDTPYGCSVWWRGKKCTDTRTGAVAQLDRDDTGSGRWKGGPETIRIMKAAPGQYRLYARRYSRGDIMASKSVVTVIKSDGSMQQFHLMRGDGVLTHVEDGGPTTGVMDQVHCRFFLCMRTLHGVNALKKTFSICTKKDLCILCKVLCKFAHILRHASHLFIPQSQNAWIVLTVDGTTGEIIPASAGVRRQSLYLGPRVAPFEASGSYVSVANFASENRLLLCVCVWVGGWVGGWVDGFPSPAIFFMNLCLL